MSDNPLDKTPEREARIRARAHRMWEEDGGIPGREAEYLERAEDLLAIEEHPSAGLIPPQQLEPKPEEAEIQQNYGEFPDRFADQGEWRQTPFTRKQRREYEEGKLPPTRGDAP